MADRIKKPRGKPGGARPGAGRPVGTLQPETIAKRQAAAERFTALKLSAQKVLDELALHSFSNVQDLLDESGNLRPIHTLTREQAASIASFEIIKKNMTAGDGQTDTVAKVKIIDKVKTLEMLAKHFALLTDVVKLVDGDALLARLANGRKRIAKKPE